MLQPHSTFTITYYVYIVLGCLYIYNIYIQLKIDRNELVPAFHCKSITTTSAIEYDYEIWIYMHMEGDIYTNTNIFIFLYSIPALPLLSLFNQYFFRIFFFLSIIIIDDRPKYTKNLWSIDEARGTMKYRLQTDNALVSRHNTSHRSRFISHSPWWSSSVPANFPIWPLWTVRKDWLEILKEI